MGIARITASSLGIIPQFPEIIYHMTAVGDGNHIESIISDMPEWLHDKIEKRARETSCFRLAALYLPKPDTMINLFSVLEDTWCCDPSKLRIEVEGDIGRMPYDPNVVY